MAYRKYPKRFLGTKNMFLVRTLGLPPITNGLVGMGDTSQIHARFLASVFRVLE
jgi:hypothetical protein